MRPTERTVPSARTVPPFAAPAVLTTTAITALAHLGAAFAGGHWFDEAYMLAIGRHHLDWGSADQPPLAPALAALFDQLAPGSLPVLRLPVILATAAAVVLAALIAREFGGDGRAQTLTALAQATALWFTFAGHWVTPYSLEPAQWLLLLWLPARWVRLRDDRLLLALGVVAGVAALTKFQVLLLCAVLAAAVALCGPRELLRRPMLWAGAALALLLALPTLWWQAANGWPQLRMAEVVAAEAGPLTGGRPGLAVALIVVAGIAGTVLALYGVWQLLRADDLRAYRFLGVTAVVLYVFFVATAGRQYYLAGLHGALFAAGAAGLQRRRLDGGRFGWVAWPAYTVSVIAAAGMLALSVLSASPDVPRTLADRARTGYQALPAADRPGTVVFGGSYIVAAYLEVQGTGLPAVYSTNRSYGYFAPPPESARHVLWVGAEPDRLRPHFAGCTRTIDGGAESVWFCRDRLEPWRELWPRLRNLTVM